MHPKRTTHLALLPFLLLFAACGDDGGPSGPSTEEVSFIGPEYAGGDFLFGVVTIVDVNSLETEQVPQRSVIGYSWSPDGHRVATTISTASGRWEIVLMRPDSSDYHAIAVPDRNVSNAHWSPQGTRLAYVRDPDYFSAEPGELMVGGPNGEGAVAVAPVAQANPYEAGEVFVWLPDGSGLVYLAGDGELYRVNVDGSNRTALTSNGIQKRRLSLSAKAGKLAMECASPQTPRICTVRMDGSGWTLHETGADGATYPAISPDGLHVAFVAQTPLEGRLRVLTLADGTVSDLARSNRADAAAWSPDGTRLVYADVDTQSAGRAVKLIERNRGEPVDLARAGRMFKWRPG